jgi:AcrR family transcriptional regulator
MPTKPRRSGRRPGLSDTRDLILRAALAQFAANGYERASLRAIALDAGVDQKLIAHYFGSKRGLFAEAIRLPIEPAELLSQLLDGDQASIGERLARLAVGILEDPATRERMLGVIRAVASQPEVAHTLREFIEREVLGAAEAELGEDAPRRLALAASQIVGLALARHIVELVPLAQASSEQLVEALAPTFQRYLTGPLD